jgi:hypothetical protein
MCYGGTAANALPGHSGIQELSRSTLSHPGRDRGARCNLKTWRSRCDAHGDTGYRRDKQYRDTAVVWSVWHDDHRRGLQGKSCRVPRKGERQVFGWFSRLRKPCINAATSTRPIQILCVFCPGSQPLHREGRCCGTMQMMAPQTYQARMLLRSQPGPSREAARTSVLQCSMRGLTPSTRPSSQP